jgi:ABC-type dipeptide/oligopeptide/nickel transport system permease subunit
MAEPSVSAGVVVAAGMTFFGVSTGLDPSVLIAGLAGGLWAQSYQQSTNLLRRIPAIALSSLLAGYLAPAAAAMALYYMPIRLLDIRLPSAVIIGLTCHRVLGPALMRIAAKKLEDTIP